MSDKIVVFYDPSRNPEGRFFGGVPLRDMTDDEWDAIPENIQASVIAQPFYLRSKPRQKTDATADAKTPPAESESVAAPEEK